MAMASLVAPLSAQKLMQTSVRGLLVVQLPNGKHAGSASQLNATVVPTDSHFEVRFNQAVGEMMSSSVKEVTKYLSVQYQDEIPEGKAIELGFADKYTRQKTDLLPLWLVLCWGIPSSPGTSSTPSSRLPET